MACIGLNILFIIDKNYRFVNGYYGIGYFLPVKTFCL